MKDLEFTKNEKIELAYDIGAGIMSVIAVLVVMLEFSKSLSPIEMKIVNITDVCIYIIFVLDYLIRLLTCKNKKVFFKHNIIDLIAIIPLGFGSNNAFSAFKLIKVAAYILRLVGNIKEILFTNGFIYALGSTFGITIISSIGLYIFESGTGNIKNYGDALWWSFVTVTTVGYGDISPSTNGGRFIACILMITGIGFLSMLTSAISTFFFKGIESKKKKEKESSNKNTDDKLDISDLSLEKRQSLINYYEYLKNN